MSPEITALIIERGITAAVGGILLFMSTKQEGLKKKILAVSGGGIVATQLLLIFVGLTLNLDSEQPISRETVQQEIDSRGVLLDEDLIFRSKSGYSVLLPKGYTYTESVNKQLPFIAINKTTFGNISIMNGHTSTPLNEFIEEVQSSMFITNSTYEFSPSREVEINENSGICFDLTVKKPQGIIQGVCYFIKKGKEFVYISCSSVDYLFENNRSDFEKVIHSLVM